MSLERKIFEQGPKVELRTVPDLKMLTDASFLISKYSWGIEYPVPPLDEIRKAEYCVGAYSADTLVGFAGVSRYASPDGEDCGELWFGYAVVAPEHRGQGVYRMLYDACMKYMRGASGRILCCTDNPIIESFILSHGWHVIRSTHDESGAACLVFEYERMRGSPETFSLPTNCDSSNSRIETH
jgi:GNAT superfamily N-acetyltransferase